MPDNEYSINHLRSLLGYEPLEGGDRLITLNESYITIYEILDAVEKVDGLPDIDLDKLMGKDK